MALKRGQSRGGGQKIQLVLWRGVDQTTHTLVAEAVALLKQLKHALFQCVGILTKITGQRTVGVQIQQQHPFALLGSQAAQGYGGGGLADATFLISYCPNTHVDTFYLAPKRQEFVSSWVGYDLNVCSVITQQSPSPLRAASRQFRIAATHPISA